jgi:hypothetical protein
MYLFLTAVLAFARTEGVGKALYDTVLATQRRITILLVAYISILREKLYLRKTVCIRQVREQQAFRRTIRKKWDPL